jgi:hypothetical protein
VWRVAAVVAVVRGRLAGMALLVVCWGLLLVVCWGLLLAGSTPEVVLMAALVGACLAGWEETAQEAAACMVATSCPLLAAGWLLGAGRQMAGGWRWGAGLLWGAGHMVAAVLLVYCPCWCHA